AECAARTDARLLVVPGLECEAAPDWVHVLGFNVRGLITTRSAAAIGEAIPSPGGFAAPPPPPHPAPSPPRGRGHEQPPAGVGSVEWQGRWRPHAPGHEPGRLHGAPALPPSSHAARGSRPAPPGELPRHLPRGG